jgi:hypothetical protein
VYIRLSMPHDRRIEHFFVSNFLMWNAHEHWKKITTARRDEKNWRNPKT